MVLEEVATFQREHVAAVGVEALLEEARLERNAAVGERAKCLRHFSASDWSGAYGWPLTILNTQAWSHGLSAGGWRLRPSGPRDHVTGARVPRRWTDLISSGYRYLNDRISSSSPGQPRQMA